MGALLCREAEINDRTRETPPGPPPNTEPSWGLLRLTGSCVRNLRIFPSQHSHQPRPRTSLSVSVHWPLGSWRSHGDHLVRCTRGGRTGGKNTSAYFSQIICRDTFGLAKSIDPPFPLLPGGILTGLTGSAPGVWDDTLHVWALNAIFFFYNNENMV